MRTLFEIIDSAKSGEMPTHDECYWSMLVLDALNTFDAMGLRRLVSNKSKFITPEFLLGESFSRTKRALNSDPKVYVGPSNDPSTEEYQNRRRIGLKILNKVMGESD